MKTRSAPMILLLMLSLFGATSRGIDGFDRLKFRLGDGYQVIAHGAIGRLDGLNLLIDTGSIPSMVDGRIAEKLGLEITEAESVVFDRTIRVLSATLSNVRVGPILADTVLASAGIGTPTTLKGSGLTYLALASWFPDGRRVAFVARGNTTSPRVYVQDIDGEPLAIGLSRRRTEVANVIDD